MLLDLIMPRMSGMEFLREPRADPELKSTSVVVLTTSREERHRVDSYHLNVAGYVHKPVAFESLREVLATLHRCWRPVEMP